MKFGLTILGLLIGLMLGAQPEFTLKSGEQLSHRNQFGQSTQQLEDFIAAYPSRLYDHSEALLLISYNHMQLGDYADALAANEKSLGIKAQLHADDLVNNYVRYGAIHLLRGNYHAALAYLLRAKDFPIEAIQLYAIVDGYLAATYRGLGQFEQAEAYYRQSIETLLIDYPKDHPSVITSYYYVGELYQEWGKPAEARQYFQQGLERSNASPELGFLQALLYNGLGISAGEDPAQAEVYHRKALEIANRHFGSYHRETAHAAILLARTLYQQERRDEAKEAIQQAIRSLSPEQPGLMWEQLPDSTNIAIDRPLLAEALGLKAQWLEESALPDDQKLPLALANSELAGKLLTTALDYQIDQADRIELLPIAKKALEPGIAAGVRLWKNYQDGTAQHRAFQLVEVVKMLEFRIYTGHALQLSGPYAQKERDLQRDLRLAELNFRLQPMDITARKVVIRQETTYRQFRLEWRQAEPGQYQERFGLPWLSVPKLQQQLAPNTALLSYFMGSKNRYLFALDSDEMQTFNLSKTGEELQESIPNDGLTQDTHQLLQAIDSSDAINFAAAAHGLYEQLLAPAASWLKPHDALLILPDGPLRDIPFESLLPKAPKKKVNFYKLGYLLDDFAIYYHHAASVWGASMVSEAVAPTYELLFLSPVFDKERVAQVNSARQMLFDPVLHPESPISDGRHFTQLSQVEGNARHLEDLFTGKGQKSLFHLREAATETLLKQEFGKAHYIHLASYGFVQGPSPEEAGLVLATPNNTTASEDDGLLLASELSRAAWNATELLSIDFTTFGQDDLSRSAGIIPLSGSLLRAGISDVLYATRPDGSSLLFTLFYQQLLEGSSKPQALQAAKRSLIREKETADPKFWSGYRLLGR